MNIIFELNLLFITVDKFLRGIMSLADEILEQVEEYENFEKKMKEIKPAMVQKLSKYIKSVAKKQDKSVAELCREAKLNYQTIQSALNKSARHISTAKIKEILEKIKE